MMTTQMTLAPSPEDDAVAALVREERLLEAAELACSFGNHRVASSLFERACDFARAADHALKDGNVARALMLAVHANAREIAESALERLTSQPVEAERLARELEVRGDSAWAARLYETLGASKDAARAYEHAGNAVAAARHHESLGNIALASRVLEQTVRSHPNSTETLLALGELLLRHGKTEAAARYLQRVPKDSPERRAALTHLSIALRELGLRESASVANTELAQLGGPVEPPAPINHLHDDARPIDHPRLLGKYRVLRDVASSSVARVFECEDEVRGERVAVKVFAGHALRGEGRDALLRFRREAKALGSLMHPNIVPFRDFSEEGPTLIVTWMAGGTLEQMLAAHALAPARAIEIASAVLDALFEAHRLGILHRDVKPSNVLFDDAGVTYLADFGVAHLSDASTTATAGVLGSFVYMTPEQRRGEPATISSDGFAVGVMLWEMLTGALPRYSKGEPEPQFPERPWPSDLHRELSAQHDHAVLALFHPDAGERPIDTRAAKATLHALRWPTAIERPPPEEHAEGASATSPSVARSEAAPEASNLDPWLARATQCFPLNDATLDRARAFARADHRSLPLLIRVDTIHQSIVVISPAGHPLDARLTLEEAEHIRTALHRLHAEGHAYGLLSVDTIFRDESGQLTLAFTPLPTTNFDADWAALEALTRPSPEPG